MHNLENTAQAQKIENERISELYSKLEQLEVNLYKKMDENMQNILEKVMDVERSAVTQAL